MNHGDRPFDELDLYVRQIQSQIGCTASAIYVIHKDNVVHERYWGRHSEDSDARAVDKQTQFNVASIRKTYLALAISLLIEKRLIGSIDDAFADYLPDYAEVASGVTLRHLLTHTHGLNIDRQDGVLIKEFEAGTSWAYRNAGIGLLIELVRRLSGQPLSELLQQQLFGPAGWNETGWRTERNERLIYNHYEAEDNWVGPNDSSAGDQSNLFVSARELAAWGQLHLRRGKLRQGGEPLFPQQVFDRILTIQTPASVPQSMPRNSFIWWLQHQTPSNEIGDHLPEGSFQVLGITGCACLVIPRYDAVIVRMYNQLRNPGDYDYLADIRTFGNLALAGIARL
ncbi:penicillin-binding protein [Paenibacillus sp. CCS19]|uniref:serine hydrolase domain-containing protein n=1 Tax=Paenibacillus sp. CCS19 TaxID=3158387 RepID=UPI002567F80D|nr:serine hydrolase domain-containing protein [Paenibacillus cellulosilyticus]GMK41889.1 penicillin-binding protein [Paenibacillus cellulosilyticus]